MQRFSSSGTFLTKWGAAGSGAGQFHSPFGLAVTTTGSVYVADTDNNRIQEFNATGGFLRQWGIPGSGAGQFIEPYGVAVDGSNNVYVSDVGNSRIQKFDSFGNFIVQWGAPGDGDAQFALPFGIATASGGHIYVADVYNFRIQEFGQVPEIISASFAAKVLTITGGGFGPAPKVLVNGADRSMYVTAVATNTITLRAKRKLLGLVSGPNEVEVIGEGGQATNVFTITL